MNKTIFKVSIIILLFGCNCGNYVHYDSVLPYTDTIHKACKTNKWGFIDKNYKQITPIKYDFIGNFSEGLCDVRIGDKLGFIDYKGHEKIPLIYESGSSVFINGLACVKLNNKFGFIDTSGKTIIDFQFNRYTEFSNGLAVVGKDGVFGFIDYSGNFVLKTDYDHLSSLNENGLAIFRKRSKYGVINKDGKVITDVEYDFINDYTENLAEVKLNNKAGFIDINGKVVIPLIFDDAWFFYNSIAPVKVGTQWGFIDHSGNIVVKPQYDMFRYMTGDRIVVLKGDKEYILRKEKGEYVTK